MKISEAIKELQELKREFGDIELLNEDDEDPRFQYREAIDDGDEDDVEEAILVS